MNNLIVGISVVMCRMRKCRPPIKKMHDRINLCRVGTKERHAGIKDCHGYMKHVRMKINNMPF
jgi:hypothetical protein